MKIGIVNQGIGNVGSVHSALAFYRYNVLLVNKPSDLKDIGVIVLAGVGNFPTAVSRMRDSKLWDRINEEVLVKKKPVIGICLGMQLFADVGYEGGEHKGFGWIKGKVVKLNGDNLKLPHMGWNKVDASDTALFSGMRYSFFYFMHSYHFLPDDNSVVVATTNYGDAKIISAVRQDNIAGVQFHPEKSQADGLRLLRNMIETVR
jgi:imidazole glycerol-phosphate synthase subunit HisH